MSLSKEQVETVARLARLALTEQEKEKFATQLSSILNYVEQLSELTTDGVEPTAQVTGLENRLREDTVDSSSPEETRALLDQAPETEDNLIKTKSVFE